MLVAVRTRVVLTALVALVAALVLVPAAIAAPEPVVERDIPFGAAGAEGMSLDVWHEPGAKGLRPVLVLVHGGGWQEGRPQQWEWNDWTSPFVRGGFVVVVVDYRLACPPDVAWADGQLPPAWLCGHSMAESRADVDDSVRWVSANVARYGGDPKRVVLLGASAGAQLALMTSSDPELAAKLRGVVAISPPADLESIGRRSLRLVNAVAQSIGCAWADCPDAWRRQSPMVALRTARRLVPTYVYASRRDARVRYADVAAFVKMLQARKADVTVREPAFASSGCHGPWSCERFRVAFTGRRLKTDIVTWMRTVALAPPAAKPAKPAARPQAPAASP